MIEVTITRDKIAGCILGGALGDALGRPTEFMSLKEIHKRYGRSGRMTLPQPALFTDDTQLTLRVAWALRDARSPTPRELVRVLTNQFLAWQRYDDARAPGITCMTAIRALERTRRRHGSWTAASVLSQGCGANMRVAPVAFLSTQRDVTGVSQLQAALTHGHPVVLAATEATALAIRWATEVVDLAELPHRLHAHATTQLGVYRGKWLGRLHERWPRDAVEEMSTAWASVRRTIENVMYALALERDMPADQCRVLGGAWVADEALANALYCAIRHADDPVRAISAGARTSGDSDSIASITGQIVGAHHGYAAWPSHWARRIERIRDVHSAISATWAVHLGERW